LVYVLSTVVDESLWIELTSRANSISIHRCDASLNLKPYLVPLPRPFSAYASDRREASMNRPTPLGLSDEVPPPDGMSPHAGCRIPGPLGTVTDGVSNWSAVQSPAVANEAARGESLSLPFVVGADTYRLRQVDPGWRLSANEVAVPPPQAGAIIERAAAQHSRNVALLRLLETAASQLAEVHEGGTFVLVRLRPQSASGKVEKSAPPPPAPKPRPAPLPVPAVEEPMMAAAQAASLKNAAASGAPFCEECARAAAQRAAGTAA
jgi:hypothetical protein